MACTSLDAVEPLQLLQLFQVRCARLTPLRWGLAN
jgi:hypothetical protein